MTISHRMNARELAFAIDPRARRVGQNYRVRCVSHDDHHASLDICERDGRVLLIDRSGRCSQREIIDALRERGLWSSRSAPRRRRWSWSEYLARTRLRPRPYRASERTRREYLLARLRDELNIAIREIEALYVRARCKLTRDVLLRELRLARDVRGINAAGLSEREIETAMNLHVTSWGNEHDDAR